MKKVFLFITITTVNLCMAQSPTKEEAKKAFLEIMKALMKNDCDKYISYQSDSVKPLMGMMPSSRTKQYKPSDFDIVISNEPVMKNRDGICSKIKEDFRGNADSLYTAYINQVDIIVLNKKEFLDTATVRIMDKKLNEGSKDDDGIVGLLPYMPKYYTDNDFLVLGNMAKDHNFIKPMGRFGWYVYIIRKTKTGWKIFAHTS